MSRPAAPPAARALPVAGAAAPPPFVLPGEHFAAALTWLVIGCAGLIAVAPALAAGDFLGPRVFAVTHVFSLGVVATSIFGALLQLFPVTMGVGARSLRLAHASFWAMVAGTATIVAGFWFWSGWAQAAGWLLVFLAVAGVSWNLLPQRRKASDGRLIGLFVAAGHSALGLAMALGLARIADTLGWWRFDRIGSLVAHYHLGVFGFATLTAAGVGSRMLPMFMLSHGYPEWPLRRLLYVASAGHLLFAVGMPFHLRWLSLPGAMLLAAAGGLYLYQVFAYFRARTRKKLDAGLAHVAAAFVALSLAVAAGLALALAPHTSHPSLWVAYALLGLLGWLVLLVIGIYYKILPFLTWLHRFGAKMGEPDVPTVADLTKPAWAWTSLVLLTAGVVVLVSGVALGSVAAARAGAIAFTAGAGFVVAQHLRIYTAHR